MWQPYEVWFVVENSHPTAIDADFPDTHEANSVTPSPNAPGTLTTASRSDRARVNKQETHLLQRS
jgi:hypothetical protein